jgi:hypothetical protein
MKIVIILLSSFVLLGCKSDVNKTKVDFSEETKQKSKQISNTNNWVEVQKINNEWVGVIPCDVYRKVMNISFSKKEGIDALTYDTGLETQWYIVKDVIEVDNERIYKTVLPFDTTETTIFKYHYIKDNALVSEWDIDDSKYYFIESSDSDKFKKVKEKCDE